MKKLLLLILLAFSITANAQQISGTQITSSVVPNDLQDNYATHVDTFGFGGYRVVPTITARDNIKPSRKIEGMLVYVTVDNKIYKLETLPNTWIEFSSGSGASQWQDITGGIEYLSGNVTVNDSLKLNGNVVQNIDTIAATTENIILNERTINLDAKIDYTGTGYTYNLFDKFVLNTLENGDNRFGRTGIYGPQFTYKNYNDSVRLVFSSSCMSTNIKGYVGNLVGLNLANNIQPNGVRAKTENLKGIKITTNVLPGNTVGSKAISDYIAGVDISQILGNYYITELENVYGINISTKIGARPGAVTTMGNYYGINLVLSDYQIAGTRAVADLYGLRLINASILTPGYGIYEDFGDNYFTNKLETADTLVTPVFVLADSSAKAIISDNDTLATTPWVRTYVDENSGGSVTFGTDNQIPVMNLAGDDFEYSANLRWTGKSLFVYDASFNLSVGYAAGNSLTTGSRNIFLGNEVGRNTTTGLRNVSIGYRSGYTNIVGGYNVFSGYQAGYFNLASYNIFIGSSSGYRNSSGASNSFIGYEAGYTNYSGNNNVFLGYHTGYLSILSNNTFLGFESGRNSTGSGNVFLGYQAGYSETGNNKLYIDNSNTSTPLIEGDFSTDEVIISGSLEVNTTVGAFIVPRMTTTERDALTGVNGMIIYNTTTNAFNFYENGSWVTK